MTHLLGIDYHIAYNQSNTRTMFYICVLFCIHILLFWRTWEITSKSRYLPCVKYTRMQVFSDQLFSCVRTESSILSLYRKVQVIVTRYSGLSYAVLIHSSRDYRKIFLLQENLDQLGSLNPPFSDTNKMSSRCDWGLNEALVKFFLIFTNCRKNSWICFLFVRYD